VWTQLENDPGLRGGRSEIRLLPPDGRTIWLQSVVQVIGDDTTPAGTPWAVSSSRDITWQREAEGSLRRTKEELDDVLEAASGILFRSEKGADGAWRMFVSDSATAITGFTPAEAAAPNFLRSRRDPAFDAAMMAHDMDVETHGTGTVRYRFRHKDGHWLWLEAFTRTAIEDDRVFYVGFTRDIAQQFERDRRAVQIAKMAILGEMTTGMAHELNQPLAAISMMAENSIALLDPDKPMHRILHPKLDRIVAQVGRAAAIIADMRHLGHGEPAARGTIGVAAAIQEANATLDGRLQRAGIGLRIDIEPGLPMAEGDARSLEQALINLIGNAADAIEMQEPPLPADRRVIRVTVALSGADIAIAVADRAGGIDSAVLPHLFEPFFTTKQAGSGTGLGLSISRGMVKHMNGTLSARNEGDGAVFEIRLPCAVASEIPA
jgi:PAS domain S-box-containing protein